MGYVYAQIDVDDIDECDLVEILEGRGYIVVKENRKQTPTLARSIPAHFMQQAVEEALKHFTEYQIAEILERALANASSKAS